MGFRYGSGSGRACPPHLKLAQVRERAGALDMPMEDWVFVWLGAPLGKKVERRRTLAQVGGAITVRKKRPGGSPSLSPSPSPR